MMRPIAAAIGVTLTIVAASAWWLHRADTTSPWPAPVASSQTGWLLPTSARPAASSRPAVVDDSSWDPALLARVERKYRYLLTDLHLLPAQLAPLRELLLLHEQLHDMTMPAADLDTQLDPVERSRIERALVMLDARIRGLLDPAQYPQYESLRDSEVAQQAGPYRGVLGNVVPLNLEQERLILEARLRHKQRFETGLRDFGLDRPSLTLAERTHAQRNVAQTLNEYRDNFLAEVRPALSEEQYFMLSSYEATEIARELERLQKLINNK